MSDKVLVSRRGPVVRVDLNRPDRHNALDGDLMARLIEVFGELAEDPEARVIVLGGQGKSWCAGADLKWMMSMAADQAGAMGTLAGLFKTINDSPKPVIARVHGAVRGGGTGLLAACDIAVALERCTFAFTEVRLGLAPAVISPYVIGKIGVPAARELFLTGSRFGAARAKELQLLNRVVATEDELDTAVAGLAHSICKGGPTAVARCKWLAQNVTRLPEDEVLPTTAKLIGELRASDEGREGMAAFLQKRAPNWAAGLAE